MSDNYTGETKPLFKLLQTEAFRFVIVRHNHDSLVSRLKEDIQRQFPDRSVFSIDAAKADWPELSRRYFELERGFFFIEHFEDLLRQDTDSMGKETPEMFASNQRRREITAGLNLRRDKLAQYPIALFAFVFGEELYARTVMEKMPDLWSLRSLLLDLKTDHPPAIVDNYEKLFSLLSQMSLGTEDNPADDIPDKSAELHRLKSLLTTTPEEETALRRTLYPQIVDLYRAMELYEEALKAAQEWEQISTEEQHLGALIAKGDNYISLGRYDEALACYQSAKTASDLLRNERISLILLEKIATAYTFDKQFEAGIELINAYIRRLKLMIKSNPNDLELKRELAQGYKRKAGNLLQRKFLRRAAECYKHSVALHKEIYHSNPAWISNKQELALTNLLLGLILSLIEISGLMKKVAGKAQDLMEDLGNNKLDNSNAGKLVHEWGLLSNELGLLRNELGLLINYTKQDAFQSDNVSTYLREAEVLYSELLEDAPETRKPFYLAQLNFIKAKTP